MENVGLMVALAGAMTKAPSSEQVASAVDAWLEDNPEATTTVQDGAITNAKLASSFVTPGTAAAYSSSAKYAVGDYCFHNGSLYRCITAITTAETWTAAHWTAAVLGDDVSDLKSAINSVIPAFYDPFATNVSKLSSGSSVSYFGWNSAYGALTVGKVYMFELSSTENITIGSITIGTSDTAASQFKTIGSNVTISANGKWQSEPIAADRENIKTMRMDANNTNLTLNIYVVNDEKYNQYGQKITQIQDDINSLITIDSGIAFRKLYGGIYFTCSPTKFPTNKKISICLENTSANSVTLETVKIGTSDTSASMVQTIASNVTILAGTKYTTDPFVLTRNDIITVRTGDTDKLNCSLIYCDPNNMNEQIAMLTDYCKQNNIISKYIDRVDLITQLTATKCFLIYTDIHGSSENLNRMSEWNEQNIKSSVLDYICLGDMVVDDFDDGIAFMDNAFGNATLKVIGNHDVLEGSSIPGVTSKQAYDQYIAPNVSSWGVTQPTGASTNGLNYYYKDYNDLRLIVLDTYFYTEAQDTWFQTVLADANTNGKTVIVAQHEDVGTASEKQPFNSDYPFARKEGGYEGLQYRTVGDGGNYLTKRGRIDSFIANGGKFACWICGHQHTDMSGYFTGTHGRQASFLFDCSAIVGALGNVRIRGYAQDCFTYFGIDTTKKYIYLVRVGICTDKWMHKNLYMVYDYGTGTVVEYNG